jgi:putative Mn2+ efflux pump MntP
MPKEDDKDTEEKEILHRFEKRFDKIEASIKKLDKTSIITLEDQFFFGLVFTLLFFVVQLPEVDVTKVFESFGIVIEPFSGFITMKDLLIGLLVLSSASRYITALTKKEENRNKYRKFSVHVLLLGVYVLIFDLTIRGFTAVLINISPFLLFLGPLTFTLITVTIGLLIEQRWYSYYGKETNPNGALLFCVMGLLMEILYFVVVLLLLFTEEIILIGVIGFSVSVLLTYVILKLTDKIDQKFKLNEKLKRRFNRLKAND